MSIYPRIVDRKKHKIVALHMNVCNNKKIPIKGSVLLDVLYAGKTILKIEGFLEVKPCKSIDKFYNFDTLNLKKGKYIVNGRFLANGIEVASDTKDNDYFIVK
jgi:hypothetical protein